MHPETSHSKKTEELTASLVGAKNGENQMTTTDEAGAAGDIHPPPPAHCPLMIRHFFGSDRGNCISPQEVRFPAAEDVFWSS